MFTTIDILSQSFRQSHFHFSKKVAKARFVLVKNIWENVWLGFWGRYPVGRKLQHYSEIKFIWRISTSYFPVRTVLSFSIEVVNENFAFLNKISDSDTIFFVSSFKVLRSSVSKIFHFCWLISFSNSFSSVPKSSISWVEVSIECFFVLN